MLIKSQLPNAFLITSFLLNSIILVKIHLLRVETECRTPGISQNLTEDSFNPFMSQSYKLFHSLSDTLASDFCQQFARRRCELFSLLSKNQLHKSEIRIPPVRQRCFMSSYTVKSSNKSPEPYLRVLYTRKSLKAMKV